MLDEQQQNKLRTSWTKITGNYPSDNTPNEKKESAHRRNTTENNMPENNMNQRPNMRNQDFGESIRANEPEYLTVQNQQHREERPDKPEVIEI